MGVSRPHAPAVQTGGREAKPPLPLSEFSMPYLDHARDGYTQWPRTWLSSFSQHLHQGWPCTAFKKMTCDLRQWYQSQAWEMQTTLQGGLQSCLCKQRGTRAWSLAVQRGSHPYCLQRRRCCSKLQRAATQHLRSSCGNRQRRDLDQRVLGEPGPPATASGSRRRLRREAMFHLPSRELRVGRARTLAAIKHA